jgi:D-glycero-alpha-D-manno-heptose-7-phosphate kinase
MIISRTPFRISFFGGGTDYPVWFQENGGSVLATTIDKFCYISCRYLPPFFEHRSRIAWSLIELVENNADIEHPAARETLRFLDLEEGVEVHHHGDLPARAGLGSSSSFTVGLLNSLCAMKGAMPSKRQLACDAIHVEQVRLQENVGCQDQIMAAFGGFNRVDFGSGEDFRVSPIILPKERIEDFQDHLALFFTGLSRTASDIAAKQIQATPNKVSELNTMLQFVDEAVGILSSSGDLGDLGRLLHENWMIKKSLTESVSTTEIDEIYGKALNAGALGGKLLGAGGGGFLLFFVNPENRDRLQQALAPLLHVPFRFERSGSQIVFYEPEIGVGN